LTILTLRRWRSFSDAVNVGERIVGVIRALRHNAPGGSIYAMTVIKINAITVPPTAATRSPTGSPPAPAPSTTKTGSRASNYSNPR